MIVLGNQKFGLLVEKNNMIIDSFLFGWELDLLKMRLHEMSSFVDKFVLIESELTFQGQSKQLYFQENKHLFSEFSDKIIAVIATLPTSNNPWDLEYASREALKSVLNMFPRDAIILHGDVDELMSKKLGNKLHYFIDDNIYALEQKMYSMAVDWKYPDWWQGTTVARVSSLDSISMLEFRNHRIYGKKICDGWHFSWLGGPEYISRKAAAFSHTEDEIQSYIKDMGERLFYEGFHVRGEKLIPVEIDNSYPEFIQKRLCPKEWFRQAKHDTLQYQQQ